MATMTVFATTQLTDLSASRKASGIIDEISLEGCYVESMNTLPVGTSIKLRISHGQETLLMNGEVINVFERRGMGIVFVGTTKDQLAVLDSWLAGRTSIVAII